MIASGINVMPLARGDKVVVGDMVITVRKPSFPQCKSILTEDETRLVYEIGRNRI